MYHSTDYFSIEKKKYHQQWRYQWQLQIYTAFYVDDTAKSTVNLYSDNKQLLIISSCIFF
jgi:hypothetical protein